MPDPGPPMPGGGGGGGGYDGGGFGGGDGGGYGGRPPASDKTSPMAIAAFVTGLLGCCGIVGIVLGAISLRQIGQSGAKGRGLAIAGIVLSCVWIVVGIVVYATGGLDGSSSSGGSDTGGTKPEPSKTEKVDAKKMKLGDCINDNTGAQQETEEPVEVESVKVVPCTGPHDGEVMAVFQLPGATMPSDQQMSQLASVGCKKRMSARLNRDPAASALATSYYYPTKESGTGGDRAVTCVAVAAKDGQKLSRKLHS